MINLPTKFEVHSFTRYGNMYGVEKCTKRYSTSTLASSYEVVENTSTVLATIFVGWRTQPYGTVSTQGLYTCRGYNEKGKIGKSSKWDERAQRNKSTISPQREKERKGKK